MEDGRTVPFYQFRHLTFQEYLTAVAATEGHYKQYQQVDTVLTPLTTYLLAEEWKEVIPMVAVLARKRAEPLLVELISEGNSLRSAVESSDAAEVVRVNTDKKLSGPAGRLVQCFIEEAEASPETISAALQLIAFFAHGCRSADDWATFCRGPYGEELYTQAWELLISKQWPNETGLMNSCAGIAYYQKPHDYWMSLQGQEEIKSLLQNEKKEELGRGLLIYMGMLWIQLIGNRDYGKIVELIPIDLIEPHLLHKDRDIWCVSTWVWTNTRRRHKSPGRVSRAILDALLHNWLGRSDYRKRELAAYAMHCQIGIDRDFWTPKLTESQAREVRELFDAPEDSKDFYYNCEKSACFFVAYHAKTVWTDQELVSRIEALDKLHFEADGGPKWDVIRTTLGVKIPAKKRINRK